MGEENGIEPIEFFPQALSAEIGCGVHHQPGFLESDVNRGTGAMVFRICKELGGIFFADDRYSLGGSRAEKR